MHLAHQGQDDDANQCAAEDDLQIGATPFVRGLLLCTPHQYQQREDNDEQQNNSWHGGYASCDEPVSNANSIRFGESLRRFFELAQQCLIAVRVRLAQCGDTALGKSAHGTQ
jgi:hypothetical protein